MTISKLKYNITKISAVINAKIYNNGVNVFWWNERKNFGDLIMPELLLSFNLTPIHRYPLDAQLVGVGSLIQMLPKNYSGMILGTGLISDSHIELPYAKFLSVRGELTKEAMSLSKTTPTGDLGLISDKLLSNEKPIKKYELGIIPHYVDKGHPWILEIKKFYGNKCKIIDVEASAKQVTSEISMCHSIISSSLHGLIVADSLKIPNTWIELSTLVHGGGFKFRDYGTSIDYEQQCYLPKTLKSITQIEESLSNKSNAKITQKQHEIYNTLSQVVLCQGT